MNHTTQLNSLLKMQARYKAFLTFCPPNKVSALVLELHRIELRIKKINSMTIEESLNEVPFYFETKQSKANFITI